MKLKFLLISMLSVMLWSIDSIAQTTITIPSANTAGTGASVTIRRKPLGSNRSYERTAMKYSQNEIGMLGNITGISFYCDTVINPGKTAVKVYIKEVSDTTFATGSTVANEELSATLVYADTLFPASFVKNTWVNIPFSTPFLHANNTHIELIIETNSGGTNGTDLTSLSKGFRYSAKGLINSMQYWQSNTNSSTIPTGNGTLSNNRPNIQFTLTAAAGCTAPPNAGTTLSSVIAACNGTNFTLSLTGTSTGLGLTYQWLSSSNNIAWDTVVGATQNTLTTNQLANKYYACIVNCNGQSDTSVSVNVTMNPFYLCYCKTNLGGSCSGPQGTAIDSVSITGTTLAKGGTGCSIGAYTSYPATGNTTAILTRGNLYPLSVKYTGNVKISAWIDYNQNGIFENSEWTPVALSTTTSNMMNANIIIPTNATLGTTGMRIRTRASNSQNDSTSACANFGNSGETEDYTVTIIAATPCITPPTAGTLSATDTITCVGSNVTVSLIGNTKGTGQIYIWATSNDSITWTTNTVLIDQPYTFVVTGNTYIKCTLFCNGFDDVTNILHITTKPFYNCYCVSGIGGNCTQQATAIDSIGITGTTLNNVGSGCGVNYYTSFPGIANTTASLTQGESYTLNAKFTGNVRASVWIDYNHNGLFENSEWNQICTSSTANTNVSASINIPMNALIGNTGMRIRSRASTGANDSTSACTTFGSGETEDYTITILQSLPCVQPPTAGTTVSSTRAVCSGSIVNFNIIGNTTGFGQSYQWIKSTNTGTWAPIAGQTSINLKDTVYQNSSYACILTCSGFSDTSSASVVTINPFYNCYCVTGLGGGCAASATSIDSVAIINTTLNNYSVGCAPGFYTSYADTGSTTAKLLVNDSYAFQTKFGGVVNASVWIDYDHSGSFDTTEWTLITDTSIVNEITTSFIDIPANAKLGKTGMRIRSRAIAGVNTSVNACTTFGSGETEDYIITIDTLAIVQGVSNVKHDEYVKVYPNPASTSITIAQTKLKNGVIYIYDLQGRLIVNEILNENINTISTNELENGIYLYRYVDINSNLKSTGKISILK